MALTRPRLGQFNTTVSSLTDPITVLHGGATTANVDVGFLMNRANGLVSNVALFWSEQSGAFVTAFTSNTGVTNTNIAVTTYAPVSTGALNVSGDLIVSGTISAASIAQTVYVTTGIGTAPTIIDSFSATEFRSAKYTTSVTDITNTGYQVAEITLMNDGTYANISVYGLVYSGTSSKMTFSSNIVSGNVTLWGTGASANNTIKLVRLALPV